MCRTERNLYRSAAIGVMRPHTLVLPLEIASHDIVIGIVVGIKEITASPFTGTALQCMTVHSGCRHGFELNFQCNCYLYNKQGEPSERFKVLEELYVYIPGTYQFL
ncbi:hypothetical protein AcW1_000175 [Taiwanofungus camphoratus]|nr:hypothetical protein AcW2_001331 [Antrodia cinnamomea]KAI0935736.1 hypothetical protein AcV5_004072 [Antrodia cinnamomea]KAI0960960.1 hypothetical protein AcV7_000194 [Antrodia cinnamomea]KAI0962957.1 hypothetical protein AcW1_000175 [Antrodia cinnamomea]